MASFRSLLLGNQSDTDKEKVTKAVTAPPITPAVAQPAPPATPAPLTGLGMQGNAANAPGGVSRLVKARIENVLSKNPDDERELRRLITAGLPKDEFNDIANPIFERLGISRFATTSVDPFDFLTATTPSMPGPREYKAELQADKETERQIGQVDTEELVTRGLGATGTTITPNIFKPITPVKTGGGPTGGNTRPAVVGASRSTGGMEVDDFIAGVAPSITSIAKRTGKTEQQVSDDIRTRITEAREAPAKMTSAYDKLLGAITKRFNRLPSGAEETGNVGGAKKFTNYLVDFTQFGNRKAFMGVIERAIGKQSSGAFLGSIANKPSIDRMNIITRAAEASGASADAAASIGKYLDGLAEAYTSAQGKNRTAIAEGFGNFVTLQGLLDDPANKVPRNVAEKLITQAQGMFDDALENMGEFGAGKNLTSKLIGQDTLSNLMNRGLVSFLQLGNNYDDWQKLKVDNKDVLPWAEDGRLTVDQVNKNFTKDVLGAARAIVVKRIGEQFKVKYKDTPIGNKQQVVLDLVTALLKTNPPFIARLENNIEDLSKKGLVAQTLASGNKSAVKLMEAMKTGTQVGKAGALIDPVTNKSISGPAVAAAQRLNIANIVEQITKLDWFGSGTSGDPNSISARAFESRVRQAIQAITQDTPDWGMFAKKLSPYATPQQLALMLPPSYGKTFAKNPYRGLNKETVIDPVTGKPQEVLIPRKYEKDDILSDALARNFQRLTRATLSTNEDGQLVIKGRGIKGEALLRDSVMQIKNNLTEQLINKRFAELSSLDPAYAVKNRKTPLDFYEKTLAVVSNPKIANLKFWSDLMGRAPEAAGVFKGMRGGQVVSATSATELSEDRLPERLRQRRLLLDVQGRLITEAKRTEKNVDVPDAVTGFVRGYRVFGISPYLIDAEGKTPTGYSPKGLQEKIAANPDAWDDYVKDAGRLGAAFQRQDLSDELLGTSVRTAIQGLTPNKAASIIGYTKGDKDTNFRELISVLRKIPQQSERLLGDGISTVGKTGGLVAGLDNIARGLREGKVLPKQLSGASGVGRSQVIEEDALFDVARQVIRQMAERLGPADKNLLFWNPDYKKKFDRIEASGKSGEIKLALQREALREFVDDPTNHRGLLSIISNSNSPEAALAKLQNLQRVVSVALERSIPRPPAKNRGRQNPTADRALRNVEAGRTEGPRNVATIGEKGPEGAGFKTKTGQTVSSNYIPQQFMGELTPEAWVDKVKSDIDRWNASSRKGNQITPAEKIIINRVADDLASGKTYDQLSKSPRFEGDTKALDMAMSFLRFEPGSRFDLSGVGSRSMIAGASPALPAPRKAPGVVLGDQAQKAKGKGLLSRIRKPGMMLVPTAAGVFGERVRSNLSQQVRDGNATKK
jgi:hypothetical protein